LIRIDFASAVFGSVCRLVLGRVATADAIHLFTPNDLPKIAHINPRAANRALNKVVRLIGWRCDRAIGRSIRQQRCTLAIQNVPSPIRIMAGLLGLSP
jgi:hypothetical protein